LSETEELTAAAQEAERAPRPAIVTAVTIGGKVIDILPVIPFRMPTWQALRKQGVDPLRLARSAGKNEMDLEPLEKIALAAIRMVEPHMPMDEIMGGLRFSDITNLALAVLQAEHGNLDRPTSTESSSSPNGGDGGPVTSLN
jgi:hypothetical protein